MRAFKIQDKIDDSLFTAEAASLQVLQDKASKPEFEYEFELDIVEC